MKKTLLNVIVINLVILFIYLIVGVSQFAIDLVNSKLIVSAFIFIFLSILLLLYFVIHISYFKQKVCLITIASLMITLMVLRVLKYGGFSQIDIVSRHLWYLYYLPVLFIPYFLLVTSLSNYYETHKKGVLIACAFTGAISLILAVFISLNDFHQTAFKFNEGFVNWDSDYSHGITYYIVLVYVALQYIASFVVFFRQCQIAKGRRYSYISLIPLILGFAYMLLYIFNLTPKYKGYSILCEFPETLCFMIGGYIFSLISLRIIPSNRNYGNMFLHMSLPAFITDRSNKVVYQNTDSELIKDVKEEQMVVDNYLYQNTAIPGGKITWISDISDLNAIYQELSELNDRLKEEEQLNLLTSNLKEEQLAILEKDKLYDGIAKDVFDESSKIMELSREIKKDMSLFDKNMPIILLLSIYIKRFANLKLLSEEKQEVELNELYLSINETLRYLEKIGIKTALVGECKGTYSSTKISEAYTFIGKTIINNLDNISGVTVLFNDAYLLKINIEGIDLKINEFSYTSISKEDDVTYIIIKKEGTK